MAEAILQETGCRLSQRTPSRDRAWVEIPGPRQVSATRVIAAVILDRPIEPDEDVHHTCHTPRCMEPMHLFVALASDHQEGHAEQQRQEMCSVHRIPYERREVRGWGVCRECRREAVRRWAARNPEKLRARRQTESYREMQRKALKKHRSTEAYRKRAAEYQQRRRARLRTERSSDS